MDITFYVLVTLACAVLVLAMWACAAHNTTKWGPDLTMELPPHVIMDALFHPTAKGLKEKGGKTSEVSPSAPSDLAGDPLLSHAQPMGLSNPPSFNVCRPMYTNTVVRVLPTACVPQHKLRPTMYSFTTEQPA